MNVAVTIAMPDAAMHASREELDAFVQGLLAEDRATLVERHVSECDACCQTLIDLSQSADTFVQLLREAGHSVQSSAADETPLELANHQRYEVLELVGEGGMGCVYRARHRVMDRAVALKVINRRFAPEPLAVERFQREVQAAAKLTHPNIVTAYDAEQEGPWHFLVMEYVEGTNLAETVAGQGPLPCELAGAYIRQAALGLQHAHRSGMVHRDIKPHNLMLTADGVVKILDFGLASLVASPPPIDHQPPTDSQLTSAGVIMGTPDYMSPEQAQDSSNVDARSDIYSLGATFYFLLTGAPPPANNAVSTRFARRPAADLASVNAQHCELPRELETILSRMLAADPNQRFQNAQEVADALLSFDEESKLAEKPQFGTPPVAERKPVSKSTSGWPTWRIAMGGVALSLAALLAFAVAGLSPWNAQPNPNTDSADTTASITEPTTRISQRGGSQDASPKPALVEKALRDMRFTEIPGGVFAMGTPRFSKATPSERSHKVSLSQSYEIGVHEVTQQQFEWVMGFNPSAFSDAGERAEQVRGTETRRLPVERVSWREAVEFCGRLSDHSASRFAGYRYRLPTEAEWEFACRGRADTAFSFGESLNGVQANVNGQQPWGDTAKGPSLQRTTRVGSYSPNTFGLFDMHGNVWEWCADWYAIDYYENSPETDPQGPDSGSTRVVRGGAWDWGANYARSATREQRSPDFREANLGFRVVRTRMNASPN